MLTPPVPMDGLSFKKAQKVGAQGLLNVLMGKVGQMNEKIVKREADF